MENFSVADKYHRILVRHCGYIHLFRIRWCIYYSLCFFEYLACEGLFSYDSLKTKTFLPKFKIYGFGIVFQLYPKLESQGATLTVCRNNLEIEWAWFYLHGDIITCAQECYLFYFISFEQRTPKASSSKCSVGQLLNK